MEPEMNINFHDLAVEKAITGIARAIKENPDTSGGVQLRHFLWSLYNQYHVVNLWNFVSRVSGDEAEDALQLLTAALHGKLSEDHIKHGLSISGELKRWEQATLMDNAESNLTDACLKIISALEKTPPGYQYVELFRILRKLEELKATIPDPLGGEDL